MMWRAAFRFVQQARMPAAQNGGHSQTNDHGLHSWCFSGAALAAAALASSAPGQSTAAEAPNQEPKAQAARGASSTSGRDTTQPSPASSNHPLEYDPVTNEHTAQMTLARIAAIEHYQAGRYKEAEARFKEMLAEARLGFSASDPHIASAMNTLAEFYRNTRRFAEAEALYKQALAHLESIYGDNHWLYVSALHNLALMYEAAGQLGRAEQEMERVLALRHTMFGPHHFLYADSLFGLAHIRSRRRPGDASITKLMAQALKVVEESESPPLSVVLAWRTEQAQHLRATGAHLQAAASLRAAIAHLARDKGEQAALASALSDQLVEALLAGGRVAEAKQAQQAAVQARIGVFGNDLAVAQALLKLAALEVQAEGSKAHPSALQHAQNAAAIAESVMQAPRKATSLAQWFGKQSTPEQLIKRMQAGLLFARALKQQAGILSARQQQQEALAAYTRATEALEQTVADAKPHLLDASGVAVPMQRATEAISTLVECQLQLMECLDGLIQLTKQQPALAASSQVAALEAKQGALAAELLSSSGGA